MFRGTFQRVSGVLAACEDYVGCGLIIGVKSAGKGLTPFILMSTDISLVNGTENFFLDISGGGLG